MVIVQLPVPSTSSHMNNNVATILSQNVQSRIQKPSRMRNVLAHAEGLVMLRVVACVVSNMVESRVEAAVPGQGIRAVPADLERFRILHCSVFPFSHSAHCQGAGFAMLISLKVVKRPTKLSGFTTSQSGATSHNCTCEEERCRSCRFRRRCAGGL